MRYKLIANKYKVSCVGIGGHYGKMEEGKFEENYAEVSDNEIAMRSKIIQKAYDAGINYFDTTWRNEVEMLSRTLKPLNIRDKVFINGMVLGVFTGSEYANIDVCDYMNKWLDSRLKVIPDHRFDSFMINAIEENYDEAKCEKLIRLLEKRKQNGDFKIFGFSCHNHDLARHIADTFPEFEIIMTAYNYSNRSFEKAFHGYAGNASFIAMKPLIWAEYGIPFSSINSLPNASGLLGIDPVSDIASRAINWVASDDRISCTVSAINSLKELEELIEAGSAALSQENEKALGVYKNALSAEKYIPFFISAVYGTDNNRRKRFFGLVNLARALNVPFPVIPLNSDKTDILFEQLKERLLSEAELKGYKKYIKN